MLNYSYCENGASVKVEDLRKLPISHLILIILNDKYGSISREFAEIELKLRIKKLDIEFDDLLHFDDKVIKSRGLDIDNYLISKNVDMQKLMEAYFKYDKDKGGEYYSEELLFSEKHLCNELDLGEPFFRKVCLREIKNINNRLDKIEDLSEKELLVNVKNTLERRNLKTKEAIKQVYDKEFLEEILTINEAFNQIGDFCYDFVPEMSNEELYKIRISKLKRIKYSLLEVIDDYIFDLDMVQNLCLLNFVRKDGNKLNFQKRKLLHQVRNGFEVNYNVDAIKDSLREE